MAPHPEQEIAALRHIGEHLYRLACPHSLPLLALPCPAAPSSSRTRIMRSLHALLSLCAVLVGGTAAMLSVQRHTLILTEGVMWTDGNPRARSVFINGTSPGPTLRFQVGQRVVVRVMNHLPDANTTVHFHGLSQSLHPASDGTGMLTHWPIAPGNFFDYELHIDKRDAGTTFCHAHVGLQATAAFAPVIVEDRPRTLPRSAEERIMAVSDYFYQSDGVMEKGLLGAPFIWPGSAKSIALNGAAWGAPDACNATLATAQGVKCEASTYAGPAVIGVDYEHHYRLRWIGAQTLMHLVRVTSERHCNPTHMHCPTHRPLASLDTPSTLLPPMALWSDQSRQSSSSCSVVSATTHTSSPSPRGRWQKMGHTDATRFDSKPAGALLPPMAGPC